MAFYRHFVSRTPSIGKGVGGDGAGYRGQFNVTTIPIKYRLGFYNDWFIK
jgi:hypothetical protein